MVHAPAWATLCTQGCHNSLVTDAQYQVSHWYQSVRGVDQLHAMPQGLLLRACCSGPAANLGLKVMKQCFIIFKLLP